MAGRLPRELVARRIALIESDRNIGLIERPEYKRRWNSERGESQERRRSGLAARSLETERYWPRLGPRRCALRAAARRPRAHWTQISCRWQRSTRRWRLRRRGSSSPSLVEAEGGALPAGLRYTDDGLRKRRSGKTLWRLQRRGCHRCGVPARRRGSTQAGGSGRHSGTAQIQVGRLSKGRLLALRGRWTCPRSASCQLPGCERSSRRHAR